MNFKVCCKKNIKIVYFVMIPLLAVAMCACLVIALRILLSYKTATTDEMLTSGLLLIGVGLFAWGIYSLSYSVRLTLSVNESVIVIKRMFMQAITWNVAEIENVDFRRHHDSSRYAPKDRYIMKIFVGGKSVKVIEDEMENFDKLCNYLYEKDVPTTDEETRKLLHSRSLKIWMANHLD